MELCDLEFGIKLDFLLLLFAVSKMIAAPSDPIPQGMPSLRDVQKAGRPLSLFLQGEDEALLTDHASKY